MRSHSNHSVCWRLLAVLGLITTWAAAQAAPTIVSVVPSGGISAVPPPSVVVFTFSHAMDRDSMFVDFQSMPWPFGGGLPTALATTFTFDASGKVMTVTSATGFPGSSMISWDVSGTTVDGQDLEGETSGFFLTSSGGGQTSGSGTNAVTDFVVGAAHFYNQTNATGPVLDKDIAYIFQSVVSLKSNRTANAITVTLPTSSVRNLSSFFTSPENWTFMDYSNNLAYMNTTYPPGNYRFDVSATTSNQQVTVALPAIDQQPNAPRISNYQALQSVNPAQGFSITWDAFTGGNNANAYIYVDVGGVYHSGEFFATNALKGTVTSFAVPAGILHANSNYTVSVGFYRANWNTNSTEYRSAYRATVTTLDIYTTGGSSGGGPVSFGGAKWNGNAFEFEFATTPGQVTTIETNATLNPLSWGKFYTTNATGNKILIRDTRPPGPKLFYRSRNGS